jgi:glucose/mannose-6-phosphate isomerase
MPEENLLDSITSAEQRASLDPHGMLELVLKFPAQCREAANIIWHYGVGPSEAVEIRRIVVTGLGGSAIGGDFLRCLADEYGPIPVMVNRDYHLPHWVNRNTLVIAASYSGNTEETLQAIRDAGRAEAQIAVVTSGGKLADIAKQASYAYALVPGGQPPRSATGYMFFPQLTYLAHRSLLRHQFERDIEETLSVLENLARRLGPDVPTNQNPAKKLAQALYGKIPVIYGSQGYRGVVAYRWKSQFNENTKIAAFSNVLPEQNHNEILAWVQAQKQASNWAVIFLRDPNERFENPRIVRRVEVTAELVGRVAPVHEVMAEGESLLARLFSLVYIADFVSVYLAYLYGVCPTDISYIDHLKAELAKLG